MNADILGNSQTLILDGAMGTMLRAKGLETPPESAAITARELVEAVHRDYVEAGADIVLTNTFGANRRKLARLGLSTNDVVKASVEAAKRAAGSRALVALDIGPLGELLEPSGTLGFEDAYDCFREMALAGAAAGADLIYIETMTDLAELRCALLAAKESCSLPVVASMSFEPDGRAFTGCPVEAFALTAGGLGASALGINCSLGPVETLLVARRLCAATPLPVFIKPNAGLPDPESGAYRMDADDFALYMSEYASLGVKAVGGCCGASPEYIALLARDFKGKPVAPREFCARAAVCSATRVVELTGGLIAGERINPTNNKRLSAALAAGDLSVAGELAVAQINAGADLIDVNVGAPMLDEAALLRAAVTEVQAVCPAPLMLDSSSPAALEAALRVYCGRAVVNSVNASAESLAAVLPLVKKYGAAVVGLTLDENGIPDGADARARLARRIIDAAREHDIDPSSVIIDCVTPTLGADGEAAITALAALRRVKTELGAPTILGVSNISHGLPRRAALNASFLTLAYGAGLDIALANPSVEEISDARACFRALAGLDAGCGGYIARFSSHEDANPSAASSGEIPLRDAVILGLSEAAARAAKASLAAHAPLEVVDGELIPALDEVGARYESGGFFLPQLLRAAEAAKSAFEQVNAALARSGSADVSKGGVVLATVRGDVHDIGKNIVKTLLQNYGYSVTDLGRDVAPERVVCAARDTGAGLVGLSALMTTTLPAMAETVELIKKAGLKCPVMVGGAVVTAEYARSIGADYYCRDAKSAVDAAKEVFKA